MSKKLAIITGSPREGGNSSKMADAFVESAKKKGHEVKRFDTAFMNITGCTDCRTCYSTGQACTFNDGFSPIAEAILESDGIVFCMPVYWYSIPAQIKGVIDCMFALVIGGKDYKGKKCGIIACCEESDPTVLDGVRVPIERTAKLMEWEMAGEVLITGVNDKGDIDKTDGVLQAEDLANAF